MRTAVIISTFNEPTWLEKALWGYECQHSQNFEIVIADDGSDQRTEDVIRRFKDNSPVHLSHVWHPRDGYQKCGILNKAIQSTDADYLIFSDGDCIPRNDFVLCHQMNSQKGFFLSGGIIRLPMTTSDAIVRQDIISQRCFDLKWLRSAGLRQQLLKNLKLTQSKRLASFLNRITPTKASWNGHNSSGWKKDIIAVNGMNEQMQYGGQDRELGERLVNSGIVGRQIRYSTTLLHLDHSRGYKTNESIIRNKSIRKQTKKERIKWTPDGIMKRDSSVTV